MMSCPNCHLRLHDENRASPAINPGLTHSMTIDRGSEGHTISCPSAKDGNCDGLDDCFVSGVVCLKSVHSNVNAPNEGEEKIHTPEYLSSSLNSSPPCSKRTRNEIIEFVSTNVKECRAISLPLFLTEELSCHDFHEESIDFFEANPSDSIGPTASAKGRATPKLQLKPKLSPSTILNMRSPELLSFTEHKNLTMTTWHSSRPSEMTLWKAETRHLTTSFGFHSNRCLIKSPQEWILLMVHPSRRVYSRFLKTSPHFHNFNGLSLIDTYQTE